MLCGYDPKARDRFVDPADHERLWHKNNGYMLAPVLVDGRIGGYWRIEGSGRGEDAGGVVVRRLAQAAQGRADEPASALSTALDVRLGSVTVTRA